MSVNCFLYDMTEPILYPADLKGDLQYFCSRCPTLSPSRKALAYHLFKYHEIRNKSLMKAELDTALKIPTLPKRI